MLSLTRKTDYALVALVSLVRSKPPEASARQISDRLGVPLPVLRNVLKDLSRAGLLTSTQGVTGGYRLARAAEGVRLSEVVEAIEGPVTLTRCCALDGGEQEQRCSIESACQVKAAVRRVNEQIRRYLDQITLSDLAWNTPSSMESAPTQVAIGA